MTVSVMEKPDSRILEIKLTGKLNKEDYERFVPAVEQHMQNDGKPRLYVEMHDFEGWSAGALWEDIKFDLKHFNDIERLAFVGDKKWEKGMAAFCKPFTTAEIKYFDRNEADQARAWLQSE